MKRILLLLFTHILVCSAFAQQKLLSYVVEGSLSDSAFQGKTIYMKSYDDDKYIDSTKVINGKFVFSGKVANPMFCRMDAGRKYANLILENGHITLDIEHSPLPSGTPLNNAFRGFELSNDSIERSVTNECQQQFQTPEQEYNEFIKVQFKKVMPLLKQNYIKYYLAHSNDIVGEKAICQLKNECSKQEMDHLINQAGSWLASRSAIREIKQYYENARQTAEGQRFVDFEGKNINGTPVSLSDYVGKGKYTLVDVWSSWCGPCKKEIPNITRIYQQYKDKGLTVLGIGTWDKTENMKKAILEHHMTWPQLLDDGSKMSQLYTFNSIPQIMLFSPDGTIVARNLRGPFIEEEIEKVLSKQ